MIASGIIAGLGAIPGTAPACATTNASAPQNAAWDIALGQAGAAPADAPPAKAATAKVAPAGAAQASDPSAAPLRHRPVVAVAAAIAHASHRHAPDAEPSKPRHAQNLLAGIIFQPHLANPHLAVQITPFTGVALAAPLIPPPPVPPANLGALPAVIHLTPPTREKPVTVSVSNLLAKDAVAASNDPAVHQPHPVQEPKAPLPAVSNPKLSAASSSGIAPPKLPAMPASGAPAMPATAQSQAASLPARPTPTTKVGDAPTARPPARPAVARMPVAVPATKPLPARSPTISPAISSTAAPAAPPTLAAGIAGAVGMPSAQTAAPFPAAISAKALEPAAAGLVAATPAGLAAAVTAMHRNGDSSAVLRLDPPGLGTLAVHVGIGHDARINVMFVPATAQTAQWLHAGMDNLRQAMTNAGLALGQTGIDGGQGSGQQNGGQNTGQPADREPPRQAPQFGATAASPLAGAASAAGIRATA